MTNFQEKRRAERIPTERPVKMRHHHDCDQGKMIDISILGAGILTDAPVEENEILNIEFSLPHLGAKSIQIDGRAVHAFKVRNQFLVGLEFVDISDYNQSQIQEFTQYHRPLD